MGLGFGRTRAPLPVVSVGSLAIGGGYKTPLVALLADALARRGVRPAIVSRGYRRRTVGPRVVAHRGERLLDALDAGDEPFLLARAGHTVVVAEDRLAGARLARALGADLVILDDGFQHRRLERDLDVVALDADLAAGRRVPFGGLREPVRAAARADRVVFVGEGTVPPALAASSVVRAEVAATALVGPSGERDRPERLAGRRVAILAAIARPARVARLVERLGGEVVWFERLRDHSPISGARRRAFAARAERAGAELSLTTAKDAVRVAGGFPGLVLEIALRLEPGGSDRLLAGLGPVLGVR